MMKIQIKERSEFSEHLRYMVYEKDIDVTVVITGPQGYGKSTLSLWLAIECYPTKDGYVDFKQILESIAWLPSEYMRKVVNASEYSVVILEEAGNVASHLTYQSALNRAFAFTQQTIRFKHLFKFLNLPIFAELDPDLRRHVRYVIEVNEKEKSLVRGAVYRVSVDHFTGKIYRIKEGVVEYEPLPAKLYKLYMRKKAEIEQIRYEARLREVEELEEQMLGSPEQRAARILLNNLDVVVRKKGKKMGTIDRALLAALAGVSRYTADKVSKIYEAFGPDKVREMFLRI